jgi:ubiquinone/menaquinone biosynthesis C-methylase UbiE
MLDHVYNRCQIGRIRGVRIVLSSERIVPLDDAMADFVIIGWVLNEAGYPAELVAEAKRILKPHGRIAVMDWHKQAKDLAIPVERRIGADDVAKMAGANKLYVHRTTDLAPEAYITILSPDEPPPPPPPPPDATDERENIGAPRRGGIVMR